MIQSNAGADHEYPVSPQTRVCSTRTCITPRGHWQWQKMLYRYRNALVSITTAISRSCDCEDCCPQLQQRLHPQPHPRAEGKKMKCASCNKKLSVSVAVMQWIFIAVAPSPRYR